MLGISKGVEDGRSPPALWALGRIFMLFFLLIKACNAVSEVFMSIQLNQVSNLDWKRGFDPRNLV
jgi:hypothetical protein